MSLIKQHLYQQMMYQVTEIEFDLSTDDDSITQDMMNKLQEELNDEYIGTFWDADDGDDLVEEITSASGWCIKSIDYRHILN